MKKAFILLLTFLSFSSNAAVEITCQPTLTCDYDSGVCDTPSGWSMSPYQAFEDFSNQTTIGLSKIEGYKAIGYNLVCFYEYGDHSYISVYTYAPELTGNNWVFSGFGKFKAECSDITDPTTCAGIK